MDSDGHHRLPTMKEIQDAVIALTHVKLTEMRDPDTRAANIVMARHMLVASVRRYAPHWSYPEIAAFLGRKWHSSTHTMMTSWMSRMPYGEREMWLTRVEAKILESRGVITIRRMETRQCFGSLLSP